MNPKWLLIILIILLIISTVVIPYQKNKESFINNMKIDKIYVINLKKNTDRLEKFMENAKKANVNVERFDAIYGKELQKDHPDIFKYFVKDHKLNPGQIGCALSHIKVWQDAIDNNYNNILVFEDDAIIPENFWNKFNKAYEELPKDWDCFSLNCSWCNNIKDYGLIQKSNFNVCTISYNLNLKSINKIFNLIKNKKINEPIDVYLIENYYKKNSLYIIKPHLIEPDSLYTSDIGVGNGGRL
jgi:GR25 family glycosyltransferase involved in LPS biosynthesis